MQKMPSESTWLFWMMKHYQFRQRFDAMKEAIVHIIKADLCQSYQQICL